MWRRVFTTWPSACWNMWKVTKERTAICYPVHFPDFFIWSTLVRLHPALLPDLSVWIGTLKKIYQVLKLLLKPIYSTFKDHNKHIPPLDILSIVQERKCCFPLIINLSKLRFLEYICVTKCYFTDNGLFLDETLYSQLEWFHTATLFMAQTFLEQFARLYSNFHGNFPHSVRTFHSLLSVQKGKNHQPATPPVPPF